MLVFYASIISVINKTNKDHFPPEHKIIDIQQLFVTVKENRMKDNLRMKEDLRIQKTYDALFTAFKKLLTDKKFEDITVRELCTHAKIRTATFYTHFSDKYDFFAFMIRRIRQEFWNNSKLSLADIEPENYISSVIYAGLDFLEENDAFIYAVESNPILAPTMHMLSKEMHSQILQQFQIITDRGTKLTASPEILTELFVGAMSQICQWWYMHRKEMSKEQLLEILSAVLSKMFFVS